MSISRRDFMRLAGAYAGAVTLPGLAAASASRAALKFIDIHHHYVAPAFVEFNRRFAYGGRVNVGAMSWDLAADLRDMDAAGCAVALLSGFTPSAGGTPQDRAALSRAYNEFGAQLVQQHPDRFRLLATLPLPDVDASLKEAAYAFDTLGAAGLTVYTDAGAKYLGDASFTDLYAEMNRRRAIVFVHPHSPACCVNILPGVQDSVIEFGSATSRAIASLIFSGTTVRFPDIRFVFAHGGGTVPYLIERFLGGTQAQLSPGVTIIGTQSTHLNQPPGTALAELRRMHYDTAQINNPVALRALKSVVGASQILFGTDVWYRSVVDSARRLASSGVFNSRELRQVANGNAIRMIPSLQRMLAT